jgi:hypothetical protein
VNPHILRARMRRVEVPQAAFQAAGLTARRPPSAGRAPVPRKPQFQYHLCVVYTGQGRTAEALESARSAEHFADAEASLKPPSKLP